jgi:eukaryotic translation initiation factor 2C
VVGVVAEDVAVAIKMVVVVDAVALLVPLTLEEEEDEAMAISAAEVMAMEAAVTFTAASAALEVVADVTTVEGEDHEVVVAAEAASVANLKDLLSSRMFYLIPDVLSLINANLCSVGDSVPQPDAAITKLEDEVVRNQVTSVAQLTSNMGNLSMEDKQNLGKFPPRPAFGSKGTPVTLWANYYQVKTQAPVIYKYTMTVKEIVPEGQEETKERAPKTKGKGGKPGKSQQSGPREVKGRKLYLVIKEALNELSKKDKNLLLATEFKSQLISLRKLNLEQDNTIRFNMPSSAGSEKTDVFEVVFNGPAEARVDEMLKYVNSKTGASDDGNDPSKAMTFPKFPDVIDALNVIFGFGPRSKLDEISAVGSSRFFAFGSDSRRNEVILGRDRALKAARGYFQSVRLATGRLLLNVNVTHGVFKIDGPCAAFFDGFEVNATQSPHMARKLKLLNRFLPKTRVWIRTKYGNKEVRRSKAIHGLVSIRDINKQCRDKPPKFRHTTDFVVGPGDVSFWLEDEGNSRYITVADFYKQSMFHPPRSILI